MEVISVVLLVPKILAHRLRRRFRYLCNYKFNLGVLDWKVNQLKSVKDNVQFEVDVAERNGEVIRSEVVYWLEEMELLIADAQRLIEEMTAERGFFKRLCPNLMTRYKRSKKAMRRRRDIAKLLRKGRFREVVYTTIEKEPTRDYVDLESRDTTLMNILRALNEDNIHMVGIYGIGGVGKTTLAKEVEARVGKDKFDEVVFVEITKTPNVEKIQEVIADQLDLRFNNETERAERASQLYERLRNGKKILLILDDIWNDSYLGAIGIPSTAVFLGGCKLLLTTRNEQMLRNMSSESFPIDILSEGEAWKLFKNMTGDYIEEQELERIRTDVVEGCDGLPIAIVPLGKALRNWKEALGKISEWKEALSKQSSANISEVPNSAYISIQFSYNSLIGDEFKKAFFLCSVMQNDASVSNLLKYGIALDILEGEASKNMKDDRKKLTEVVRELKDSCLLHDGRTSEHFSMHEIVREVATSIAQKDQHVVIKCNDSLSLSSDKDNLKKCRSFLLIDSKIDEHLKELDFPKLEFFYMSNKDNSLKVPDNFFSKMPKLKVLNLIGMQLSPLPSSVHHLVNLQGLCLECSKIEDMAIIGKLQKLKILSLQGSDIKQLPKEIGQLTQLRLLDLTDCSSLEVIAANVISSLSRLEELYMMNCSVRWEAKDVNGERSNACLEDLTSLSGLTTLEINIKDVNIFPTQIFFKKLERYKIFIGDSWHVDHENENSRILKLQLNSGIYLDKLQHMTNVEVLHLKKLTSSDTRSHEIISDNEHDEQRVDYNNLKALTLREINVENICDWHLGTISFGYENLTSLIVKNCPKLKSLFSFCEANCLKRLQHFEISECPVLQEIVARGTEERSVNFVFPQVTFLRLWGIPKLKTFYPGKHTLEWPKLKKFETDNDTKMKKVVFFNSNFFEQKDSDDEKIDWENRVLRTYSHYQILTDLVVKNCPKLKFVFSSSIVNLFVHLRHIEISECIALQDIVEKEGFGKPSPDFVFPRLTLMKLRKLPNLRTFYPGIHVLKLPMLEKLQIGYCDKVSAFDSKYVSFYEDNEKGNVDVWEPQSLFLAQKINPNLKELTLGGNNTKFMWKAQFPKDHFNGLKVLGVGDDESESIPLGVLQRFKNLKELNLRQSLYEEIFSSSGEYEKHDGAPSILQDLAILRVKHCDKLVNALASSTSFQNLTILEVCFCNGLINLLTSSTAKSLERLTEMKVESCKLMIEVVAKEESINKIVFSKLKLLSLEHLESLISFCSGDYIINFPSLEELIVDNCPKMKTFSRRVASAPSVKKVKQKYHLPKNKWCPEDDDLNTIIHKLRKEEANSNSKELTLSGDDVWTTWQRQFPKHCGVEVLEIIKDESPNFPLIILEQFNDLGKLILKGSSYKEIFSSEEGKIHGGKLMQIKVLELWGLFRLKHMWEQDSELDPTLDNLEILSVKYCHNLINLAPSSKSFKNLKTLEVWYCDQLRYLVTSSTAKNLSQLEKMTVEHCELITEVVQKREDETAGDEIVFNKLKVLSLRYLEGLTSFCSGNYTLNFPVVEKIMVEKCPKMKNFSGGKVSTPRSVKLEGDLNTNIQLHNKVERRSSEYDSGQPSTFRAMKRRARILP